MIYIGSEHNSRWFIKYAKLVRNTTILFFCYRRGNTMVPSSWY